jgi:hypothetical protein
MIIIGVDFHPEFQQIASVDTDSGELREKAAGAVLFENVVQVLHRSVPTALAQRPFIFTVGDRGAVYRP